MARSRDYGDKAEQMIRALQRGDMPSYFDYLRNMASALDDQAAAIQSIQQGSQTKASGGGSQATAQIAQGGSSASRTSVVPRAISDMTALRKPLAMKVVRNAVTTASDQQIAGVNDPMTGYILQQGRDVDSEIIMNSAVNYQNGALRLASAADASLHCSGIVQMVGDYDNQWYFRDGGICYVLIKLPLQDYANRVYLSVTPGYVTTDPAEPGKVINQEVGRFRKLINPQPWQAQDASAIAEISFQYSPYS